MLPTRPKRQRSAQNDTLSAPTIDRVVQQVAPSANAAQLARQLDLATTLMDENHEALAALAR